MNIVKHLEQYKEDHVYFLEPIKNNIMNNGKFIRIIYSTPLFTLNGIYISFNINNTSIDKYYNKYKCSFDTNQYNEFIDKLTDKLKENFIGCDIIIDPLKTYIIIDWS